VHKSSGTEMSPSKVQHLCQLLTAYLYKQVGQTDFDLKLAPIFFLCTKKSPLAGETKGTVSAFQAPQA
jgi:hypothetical protein